MTFVEDLLDFHSIYDRFPDTENLGIVFRAYAQKKSTLDYIKEFRKVASRNGLIKAIENDIKYTEYRNGFGSLITRYIIPFL